jgi:hypothetical protein
LEAVKERSPEDVAQIVNSTDALQNGGPLSSDIVVKIGSGEDLDARSADFVIQLLK